MPDDDFWSRDDERRANRRGLLWALIALAVLAFLRLFGGFRPFV